jgi:hypothetical protein
MGHSQLKLVVSQKFSLFSAKNWLIEREASVQCRDAAVRTATWAEPQSNPWIPGIRADQDDENGRET